MDRTKKKFQQGFAVVELAILVVVMVTVSGIGYWAVSKSRAAVTASPDIASITPSNGPIGTQLNFKPKTKFAGHYAVNVKKVGGDFWRTNVVRLKASTDGQSLTKEDGTLWAFPEYPCTRDGSGTPEATCAASAAAGDGSGFKAFPNSSWYFSLTDATNSTGSPITGNTDKIFTVTGTTSTVTPTPNVSTTPSPASETHPSISGITPQTASLGQQITISKGTTKFKTGRYLIYFHLPNDAANKIPIGDIQNNDSTGATLKFILPTDNVAIQYNANTQGGIQVKDADNLYSNSYVFTIKAHANNPLVTPSPIVSPLITPSPIASPSPSPNISPSATYSPDIGSISPVSGPIGTKLKINAAKKFSGHYQLNLKQVGGNLLRTNVVRLKATADGKSLTNEDGSLWIFPAYPCARDASGKPDLNCANSAVADDGSGYKAVPGSKWDLSLTDANNPTGAPITGTKTARFTVTDPNATASPIPGTSPTPAVTPTPSQPWYCKYFNLFCPANPTPVPSPSPQPQATPSPSPTPKPDEDKSFWCTISFGLFGCNKDSTPKAESDIPEKEASGQGAPLTAAEEAQIDAEIDALSNLGAKARPDGPLPSPTAKPTPTPAPVKLMKIAKQEKNRDPKPCETSDNNGSGISKYQNYACGGTGVPWCAAFVSWVYNQATGNGKIKNCSVSGMVGKAKNLGWYHNYGTPKPGDILTWYGDSGGERVGHTGILVKISGSNYITIEGNGGSPNTCVKSFSAPANAWKYGPSYASNKETGFIRIK